MPLSRLSRLPLLAAALCMTAPAFAEVIEGKVVAPDGTPVPGAEVYVSLAGYPRMRDLPPVKTGPNGTFRVEGSVAPEDTTGDFLGRCVVVAPGYALSGTTLRRGKPTTVSLEPGVTLRGRVAAKGKPVAGAKVRLWAVFPEAAGPYVVVPDALAEKFTATTDAEGVYTFDGLPTSGNATVRIEDEKFARLQVSARLGPTGANAPTLEARPGGAVAGRAVGADGKPVAGARVFAQGQAGSDGWAEATTDASGRYRLTGLTAGVYNVMADAPEGAEAVAAAVAGVEVTEGGQAEARDLTFTGGAVVMGQVLDAATGQPVRGAHVGSYGPHRPRSSAAILGTRADAEGRYRLRLAPGQSKVYLSFPGAGYLSGGETTVEVKLSPGETKALDFRVRKGERVSGTVVDAGGKPVVGVALTIGRRYQDGAAVSDEKGAWSADGLRPGDFDLRAEGDWEVVGPEKITLPAAEPVRVTVRKAVRLAFRGRVVDRDGKPVPGAAVKATIQVPVGDGAFQMPSFSATTGADGTFALTSLPNGRNPAVTVEKPGYRFVRGGAIQGPDEKAAYHAEDIVLVALSEKVSGRIVSAQGKPVPGVRVVSPDNPDARAVTGADGSFTLAGLPSGDVTIYAGKANRWASGAPKAGSGGAPLVLTLAPMPAVPARDAATAARAYSLLETLWKDTTPGSRSINRDSILLTLLPGDLDAALRLATDEKGDISADLLREIAVYLLENDPTRGIPFARKNLAAMKDDYGRNALRTRLGLALVRAGQPAEARRLYSEVRAEASGAEGWDKLEAAPGGMAVTHAVFVASLGAAVRAPEAETVARRLLTGVRTNPRGAAGLGDFLVGGVAEGDPVLAERLIAELPEADRAQAFHAAIRKVARYSPTGASRLLKRMAAAGKGGMYEYFLPRAARAVVDALAPRDPAAALALARERKDPIALTTAARYQKTPAARAAAFREAFAACAAGGMSGTGAVATRSAFIAALAHDSDPALGRELFALARKRMESGVGRSWESDTYRGVAGFAFYYARADRAESRLLLETAFASARTETMNTGWNYAALIQAMAAIDPDRALEMAQDMPTDKENGEMHRLAARRKIAQYLLMSPAQRKTLPFEEWQERMDWLPGTMPFP